MDTMLDQLASAFRLHRGSPMPSELLESIDRTLANVMGETEVRDDALIGLVGIRRGLFPDALSYWPPTRETAAA